MHVKTVAEYKRHNAEDLLIGLSANDENIRVFLEKSKMSGHPVKREINSIYRLKHGGVEHFTYHQKLSSEDSLGNYIECWFPGVGKWDKPTFSYITNPETGSKIPDGIRSTETIYELEWPKHWNSELEADVVKDISNLIVIDGNRHYGGFSFQDFKERTFNELVTYGKYGVFEKPIQKIIEIEDQRRSELDKVKRSR